MSEITTAARPYARAVFELAQEKGELDVWEQRLAFMAAVASDPSMRNLLASPKLSREQAAELFNKVTGDQVGEHGQNMVRMMAENDRLALLPDILPLYQQFKAEAEGMVEAEIVSAMPVNDEQQAAIAKALQVRLGREIKLVNRIDETLIGGAVIKAGDLVIDGSIQGRFDKMVNALTR